LRVRAHGRGQSHFVADHLSMVPGHKNWDSPRSMYSCFVVV
jgi:hypothetical protein